MIGRERQRNTQKINDGKSLVQTVQNDRFSLLNTQIC